MKKRHFVGIDSGKTTGVASWDTKEKKFTRLWSGTIWQAVAYLHPAMSPTNTKIIIELPGRFVYGKHTKRKLSQKVFINMATKFGGTRREAEILRDWLKELGYEVETRQPTGRKLTHDVFCGITGWNPNKPTNQHKRDAAMLVWGY